MRTLFVVLILAGALGAQNSLTPKESQEGWLLLFDGTTLFGWTAEGGTEWRVENGSILGDAGESGWLRSNTAFANFVLKCDFRTGADGNSGIFLRSAMEGRPHETGYELQIWDKNDKFPTGSLVNHLKAKPAVANDGRWHTYEVEADGDRFVVKLDGRKILDGRDSKSRIGHIGLQYNKDKKIEFRNIKLRPLDLHEVFDGKTLAGWHEVKAPNPKEPPVWTVRDKLLHVEKGPGQLETNLLYDDFVLQLDVRANAPSPDRHPNSGVFFRGDVNGFWTGYEAQIRNEYKNNDRTQVVDYGTGGIYRYQPARRVVANDNEFFTMTVIARGRHIATWVNGYPVADWDDPNPEGKDVRKKEAKLTAGPISLQAHDPTTNLDFKEIRVVVLPK